jgi:hypothetical protein
VKKVLLSLLLFPTVTAFAQPAISPEVSSDPLPARASVNSFAIPAIAMARDRKGLAISWTSQGSDGRDQIAVVRLDGSAHFAGPVHMMPAASQAPVNGADPSFAVAPGGDGFVLVWIERTSNGAVAAYCRLDADLNPSSPLIVPTRNVLISAPPIVRSGKTTWLTADTSVWQIRADGSLSGPLDGGIMARDMTVTTEFPQLVSGITKTTDTFTCRPDLGCTVAGGPFRGYCYENCRIHQTLYSYGLGFTALYTASAAKTFPFNSDTKPAIRSDGHDALMAWFVGTESNGGLVVFARLGPSDFAHFSQAINDFRVLGTFGSDSGSPRPDIASDDDRYLVVWRTVSPNHDHDILGASVDRNGQITSFPIATSLDDERDPSVIALGSGTFLVAYEKFDSAGQRRIAGRLVTFASRSHAVR